MPGLGWYLRLILLVTPLLAPLIATGCGPGGSVGMAPDMARILANGRRDAAQWVALGRTSPEVAPEIAISLGYLERLRLGLGSPFRLIDYALNDPRLDDSTRTRTAHALLARTLDRQSYQLDPAILDLVGLAGAEWLEGVGRHHLRLIDDAISEARDPRAGELAVRLAYSLAAAEGSVAAEAPTLVAQTAALIRDRELAYADAQRLVRAAREAGSDPVHLVGGWRAGRAFEVERPALTMLAPETEREAVEFALRLARSVQALGPRLAGDLRLAGRPLAGSASLLGPGAAEALAVTATAFAAPPRTPVAVAVDAQRPEVRSPWLDREERVAWNRFLERARNEEELATEYAILLGTVPDAATAAGEAVLSAAVGLRTYAQERVWFPGFGGPASRELEDRFGLSPILFDDEVPPAWRPYYRRVLAESLSDLQRVLPSLNLRGLTFHIGASRGGAATLALHDPTERTIFLSPETGMGTIAHEVAHDLDWQVALRRYRVRGDYASDRAVRERGDRLAGSIQRLTTATLRPPIPGDPSPVIHAQRPAEVFARSIDWFVLVSLAREGRTNGYLSSAQDAMLTGYGTVRPPEIGGSAGQALVTILDEIAPIYPDARDWFLKSYGSNQIVTPYDLVRRVLEVDQVAGTGSGANGVEGVRLAVKAADDRAGDMADYETGAAVAAPGPGIAGIVAERFRALERARNAALTAVDAWVCLTPVASYDPLLGSSRRHLIARATEARGRGISLQYAVILAGGGGRDWLAHRFYGAPWPRPELDPLMTEFLDSIADEVRRLGEIGVEAWSGILPWPRSPDQCTAASIFAIL